MAQEREGRIQVTRVLKETLEKLKNHQNPAHFVADNLNMIDEMVARTPPKPVQAPLNPTSSSPALSLSSLSVDDRDTLTPESLINELHLMEDQMKRVTGNT